MINRRNRIWASILVLLLLVLPKSVFAYDHTKIIDQSEVNYNGITAGDIQNYLNSSGSELATYTIPTNFDVYYPIGQGQWDKMSVPQSWQSNLELEIYYGKSIAELVYEFSTIDRSARQPSSPGKINPLIALATMDKESGSINGPYKSNIVSSHPITLSWLMGYGFDGRMADCITNGNCDINRNRQVATWYGGPGQQIAESVSSLKNWTTNPTPLNTCNGNTTWQSMSVQGECLSLQNSISYTLYRYTPTFSGNQLFLDIYTYLKTHFSISSTSDPNNPPPTPDERSNDTNDYTLQTYGDKISLTGTKAPNNKAWFEGHVIADLGTTNWQLDFSPDFGNNQYTITYQRTDNSVINLKTLHINRHKIGDINGDGKIDILDLSILANYWGRNDPPNPLTKLTPNSDPVNILDLSILAAHWGQ